MKRSDLVAWLKSKGYVSCTGRVFHHPERPQIRYIVDEFEVRFEKSNTSGTMWSMIRHGNIPELSLNEENNRIRGMKLLHI
jgi:hypothetical protein